MKLYIVVETTVDNGSRIWTVATKEKHCLQWIRKKLMIDNLQHFTMWCEYHNKDKNDDTFNEYMMNVELNNTKYIIKKVKYTADLLAKILRLYNNCIPLGVGYETEDEYRLLFNMLPDDLRQELRKLNTSESK